MYEQMILMLPALEKVQEAVPDLLDFVVSWLPVFAFGGLLLFLTGVIFHD